MLQRLAVIVSAVCVACKSLPLSSSAATQPAITQPDLRGRLAIFSDDSMLGRDALNAGHDRAVRYLTAEVEKIGFETAGESGSYRQTFNISERRLNSASRLKVSE